MSYCRLPKENCAEYERSMRCAVPTIADGAVAHWLYQNVPSITRVAVMFKERFVHA
jgi:hypothetical protein